MKLLGFEGYEIVSMKYEIIGAKELHELSERTQEERKSDDNILVEEEVNIQITKDLTKTLIIGLVTILDLEGSRKIMLEINGEFVFDNENEKDPEVISDSIYNEFWPVLKKYIPPAISTITSITNRGELEISF